MLTYTAVADLLTSTRLLSPQTVGRLLLVSLLYGAAYADDQLSYQRDIAPLLEEHCTQCHGEDAQEAGLRLDSAVNTLRGGDSGEPAVVPGESERSYLIARVTSNNPAKRMPPDAEPLDDQQIELLRRWIEQPDHWTAAQQALAKSELEHWSFQPVVRPAVPASRFSHPVDAWVEHRLAKSGLQMSDLASRRKRIRRLYLLVHGLPPTPQQVQSFLDDQRQDAWERLVDEVLASPHYGERWATFWLDLVRFAETDGYETNRERPHAWHYRDWVIDAFNNDKPYDRFVLEQLAGDAFEEHAATGFLVAGPHDIVKGQDKLLGLVQRQDELDGIISSTGATFLGLSLGCARCHNHKFDPVSQRDYYAMQASFAGVTYANRSLPPTEHRRRQSADLDSRITQLHQEFSALIHTGSGSTDAANDNPSQPPTQTPPLKPPITPKHNVESFPPVLTRLIRFNIHRSSSAQPCLDELEVFSGDTNLALASAGTTATSSGDFVHPLHKLSHINDGRYGNPHSWIAGSANDAWVQLELPEPSTIDRIEWSRDRDGHYQDRLAVAYDIQVSTDGQNWQTIADSRTRMPTSPEQWANDFDLTGLSPANATKAKQYINQIKQLLAERHDLGKAREIWAGSFRDPEATYRLYRGDPLTPREQVAPAAISSLSDVALPADAPEQARRLTIARWIADPVNPLTARVMVNRIWQHHFGTGIVATPSDFGKNGVPPSHPQLLDWLAAEFVANDWSVKHIQRQILTSQCWQQDSRPRPQALAVDAGSRLLWRFPQRRLEAEGIRDCVLAVSGKLNLQAGGPGFSAFKVELENVRHYFPKSSFSESDWRRMIYMTRVRQERDAVFGTFDCPDFSQLVAKRSRSTTPLQAMGLMNSQFMMQQAGFLADRLVQHSKQDRVRIGFAYELCFSRSPAEDEVLLAQRAVESSGWKEFARAMLNANEFVFIP